MTEIELRNEYRAETNKPAFWTDGVHKPHLTEEYCKWLEQKLINEAENTDNPQGNGVLADVRTRLDFVWKLMGEKGLTLGERMQVRKAISDWAYQSNPNIERIHRDNTYRNKNVKGYCFEREEEAEFIGALVKFIPNADTEKLIQVMSMMLKLFDVESAWAWKGTR